MFTREPVQTGQRHHVAGVLEGTRIGLFVDGKIQEAGQLKGSYRKGRDPFLIGGLPPSPDVVRSLFSGVIDELRVSKVARYSGDFVPLVRFEPDKDTLALYHFDEGSGDVLNDASGNNHHGKIVNAKWVPGIGGARPQSRSKTSAKKPKTTAKSSETKP